jgi:hypothetical protein
MYDFATIETNTASLKKICYLSWEFHQHFNMLWLVFNDSRLFSKKPATIFPVTYALLSNTEAKSRRTISKCLSLKHGSAITLCTRGLSELIA